MLIARYTANASGVVPTFNSGYQYTVNETSNNGIYTVEINANTDFTSCSFSGKSQLLTVEYLKVTSLVINMNSMFLNCSSLTQLDVSNWDTSQVKDMQYMFYNCSSLTQLDVSNWDTSQVTTMFIMFSNCSKLTTIGDVSEWDTSKVTNMSNTFNNCSSLTQLDVSNWDTSQVTDMYNMFYNCSSLTQLDVSNWDTSQVKDMQYMFYNCSSLTQLDVSKWNTSKVTVIGYMFQNCSSLTQLDVSKWKTSKVTNISYMFRNCSFLTQLDVSNWDTSKVQYMQYMFNTCSSLTQLDVSNWDTSKVTNMNNMFYNCSSLTQLDVSNWDTSQVTTLTSTIFKPYTGMLNWSVEEINRFVSNNTDYNSIVYVNCDISQLVENELITYVNYTEDEISISLPQPLRSIGNMSDRLYWDYDKGYYCIEQNIDINEDGELYIIEFKIIELPHLNKKYEIDVYETTKIGFTNIPLDPIETTINLDTANYTVENLTSLTEYTIQFNCLIKNTDNIDIKIEDEVITSPLELGINRIKITTSNVTKKTTIVLCGEGNAIKDVMLIQGEINQDLKYFKGIESFGELQEDGNYKITITSDNYNWLWKE